jgi:hypothetical protein
LQSEIKITASKHVAELVVNGVSMLRKIRPRVILSLVDTLSNDNIIEHINILLHYATLNYSLVG